MKYFTIGILLAIMILLFGCAGQPVEKPSADTGKTSTETAPLAEEVPAEEVEELSTDIGEVEELLTELDNVDVEDIGIDETTFE